VASASTPASRTHNLMWKIAAVEAGWAGDALLDTYEVERRPVAQRNADVSLENAARLPEVYQALAAGDGLAQAIANQAEHFDMLGLQLGFAYGSGALLPNGADGPASAGSVRDYAPNARPGSRIPHAWLTRAGVRVSSLDLFAYDRFTLVTRRTWGEVTAGPVPLECISVGRDVADEGGEWTKSLDIDPDGALLVRPDQHVAWWTQSGGADAAEKLARALPAILSPA